MYSVTLENEVFVTCLLARYSFVYKRAHPLFKLLLNLMEWTDPLHPLPDDILIMKEEEKSCEYCGIPYLLHTEMSRMKRHVQDLEKQLEVSLTFFFM